MKKAIKKIVALGLGVSMMGATLLGATAVGLNEYPAPFVSGGKFSGTLVVGDSAAAEDVIGVSDVAMSLQFASAVKAGSATGSTTVVEGDAFRIHESGDNLNFMQNLTDVTSVLDDSDLNALADGTFRAKNNVDYTQTLNLPNARVQFVVDDDAEVDDPALFLKFDTGLTAVDYSLDFTTAAESDYDTTTLEDFEDEKLNILGKEYTLTQAKNQTGASNNVKLTLMSGAVQQTQEVGETKTYNINGKDYEVTVMVVSGDTSAAAVTKFIINDEVTKSLSKDDTYTLKDNIELGIKEVLPTKAGDVQQNLVEFFLGAQKVVLDGSNTRMEISEEVINDVTVTVTANGEGSEQKLNRIQIVWAPTDNYYVPVGGRLSEVVTDDDDYVAFFDKLGLDYQFSGLQGSKTEMVEFVPSGSNNYKLKFTNRKGVEYNEKVFYYDSSNVGGSVVSLGDSATKTLHLKEGEVVCDNDMFGVEFNKNSRILKLTDVNTNDNTISIQDLGTGDTSDHSHSGLSSSASIVLDGATYTVQVNTTDCIRLTNTAQGSASDNYADMWTQYDSKIALFQNLSETGAGGYNIVVTEDSDGKEEDSSDIDTMSFNMSYSASDTELRLDSSVVSTQDTGNGYASTNALISLDSDDNTNEGYTEWGNFLRQTNTDDQDKWAITITENEAVADVFVTAGTTTVSGGSAVSGDAVIVQRIDVGATKLASEVAGLETSQNMLLVGGPCANAAVEEASDEFPTCSGWGLDPGEALIQLVEHANGNVALLVAGTLAEDTRAATKLVAEGAELAALGDGVMARVLTTSTGVLMELEEPEVMEEEEEVAEEESEE